MAETTFGTAITNADGRVIPVRWIGEQHVREDLGRIPSFADWVRAIWPEPWMGRAQPLQGKKVMPKAEVQAILRSPTKRFGFWSGDRTRSGCRQRAARISRAKASFRESEV